MKFNGVGKTNVVIQKGYFFGFIHSSCGKDGFCICSLVIKKSFFLLFASSFCVQEINRTPFVDKNNYIDSTILWWNELKR